MKIVMHTCSSRRSNNSEIPFYFKYCDALASSDWNKNSQNYFFIELK